MNTSNINNLWPLREIASRLADHDITLTQLSEWERRRKTTGFPKPVETLGRYKLYDIVEVENWLILWRRVTVGLGRGKGLNDGER